MTTKKQIQQATKIQLALIEQYTGQIMSALIISDTETATHDLAPKAVEAAIELAEQVMRCRNDISRSEQEALSEM